MLNLFKLTKINFGGFFKITNFSSVTSFLKTLLFLALYCILGYFVYYYADYMVTNFHALGISSLVLSEFFAFGSMFVLALSIFRMEIFNSKDHDLLASLPISKKIIVASKLINVYIFNFLIIAIIMIPVYIAYINIASVDSLFLIKAILSLFIIPIIPTVIAVFLNSIITIISTNFKYKRVIQTVLMLILMVFSLYFAYDMNSNLKLNLFDIAGSFNNFFNSFYPLTKYFTDMLINNNVRSTIIFIGVSLISVVILVLFLSIFYNKVTNKIAVKSRRSINLKKIPNNNYFINLIKKDIKRVVCSPNYLLNSCLGMILIVLFSIILLFINIDNIENIPITKSTLINYLPLVFVFLILLSSTTSSLISLEGKCIYILKMLPLRFSSIWLSKVLSNYILILLPSFISLVLFNISLSLSLKTNIDIILLILTSGLFISLYGLTINLLFPTFSWKSEIKVIKQSASSFITIFTGLIMGLYLMFNDYVSQNNYIYFVTLGFVLLSILLIIFLEFIGPKIYTKLNE